MNNLNLTRTASALAEYDHHNYSGTVESDTFYEERERLAKAVGDAFALDTADRNRPETARLMHPADPWLRALVVKYGPAVQESV